MAGETFDQKRGLNKQEEKDFLKQGDIDKIKEEVGGDLQKLEDTIIKNYHAENFDNVSKNRVDQIKSVVGDDYYKSKLKIKSGGNEGIAALQILAMKCVDILNNKSVETMLKSQYINSWSVDGILGPNTLYVLKEISKTDLGGPAISEWNGIIDEEILNKLVNICGSNNTLEKETTVIDGDKQGQEISPVNQEELEIEVEEAPVEETEVKNEGGFNPLDPNRKVDSGNEQEVPVEEKNEEPKQKLENTTPVNQEEPEIKVEEALVEETEVKNEGGFNPLDLNRKVDSGNEQEVPVEEKNEEPKQKLENTPPVNQEEPEIEVEETPVEETEVKNEINFDIDNLKNGLKESSFLRYGLTYEIIFNRVNAIKNKEIKNRISEFILKGDIKGVQKYVGMKEGSKYDDNIADGKFDMRTLDRICNPMFGLKGKEFLDYQDIPDDVDGVYKKFEEKNLNEGKTFAIVSKSDFNMYVFNSDYSLISTHVVGLGKIKGDKKNEAYKSKNTSTTPGGMYTIDNRIFDKKQYAGPGEYIALYPEDGQYDVENSLDFTLGIHNYFRKSESDLSRKNALENKSNTNRRMSDGCINTLIEGSIYDNLILGSKVYVTFESN